jgi:hypothetical protein
MLTLQPEFVNKDGGKNVSLQDENLQGVALQPMLPFTFAGFEIQDVVRNEDSLTITARAVLPTSVCPSCQNVSRRIHSYYIRRPHDLPISGQRVELVLQVRRFRCLSQQCPCKIFAERIPVLPVFARQTGQLGTILHSIAIVLSGQAGSRLRRSISHACER